MTEPLPERFDSGSALVIGAGIAGIQAALDIADAGFKVYLVERSSSIGGRMAQLDKTFPTLDCSSCILTPKMADVPRHPNITLLTSTEVQGVEGKVGDFHIRLEKTALCGYGELYRLRIVRRGVPCQPAGGFQCRAG